jgi:hypothetical protein
MGLNKDSIALFNSEEIITFIKKNSIDIAINAKRYFDYYLTKVYDLVEITKSPTYPNVDLYVFERKSSKYRTVKCTDAYKKDALRYLAPTAENHDNRHFILPIEPYASTLGIRNRYAGGFQYFPPLCNYSIISPFFSKKESDSLKKALQNEIREKDRGKLVKFIHEIHISTLVTLKMQNWIIKNTVLDIPPTHKQILTAYSELVADYLLL